MNADLAGGFGIPANPQAPGGLHLRPAPHLIRDGYLDQITIAPPGIQLVPRIGCRSGRATPSAASARFTATHHQGHCPPMRTRFLLAGLLISLAGAAAAQNLDQLRAKYGDDVIGETCLSPGQFCAPVCRHGLAAGGGAMRCATPTEPDRQPEAAKQGAPSVVERLAGRAWYAYVAMNQVDTHLQPIRNPAGRQLTTNFCLLWLPGWSTENDDIASLGGGDSFYHHFSYRIDPDAHTLTMFQLRAPQVVVEADQVRPLGGTRTYRANLVVPMYPRPQPDWPWNRRFLPERSSPPGSSGPSGSFECRP